MPSSPRSSQVDLSATPYYHCIARCVRRAFLCGADRYSGQNYDHRKRWFLERMKLLAEVFTIDVCAFAVMSNHFHAVLRVAVARAEKLTDEAVLRRYHRLFPFVVAKVRQLDEREQKKRVAVLRERLTDISWFMRCLNEHVARRANKEDQCTGRFWEGRFKSQALLDEGAVLACMAYVDLNPVRAGASSSLEGSDFTAVQQRLREVAEAKGARARGRKPRVPLAPFRGQQISSVRQALPMRFDDYIELLEWTGPPRFEGRSRWRGEARKGARRAARSFGDAANRLRGLAPRHDHRWSCMRAHLRPCRCDGCGGPSARQALAQGQDCRAATVPPIVVARIGRVGLRRPKTRIPAFRPHS